MMNCARYIALFAWSEIFFFSKTHGLQDRKCASHVWTAARLGNGVTGKSLAHVFSPSLSEEQTSTPGVGLLMQLLKKGKAKNHDMSQYWHRDNPRTVV
jgi:hypothetical protein